ncbi:MAG TPA: glycosyltransferase family 9 protein [Bryobacteraceae bacterium]|nr:glycosyltransferase family 9 protein [Bryobacteraceae bacterium]
MRRLLIRPGGIGDCVLSLPALELLKTDYTEVWVRGDVVPLVRFADQVCSIASTGLDLLGLPEVDPPPGLVDRLRSFDSIVSWYGSNREPLVAAMQSLGVPVQFLAALPPAGERIHAADFFLRQAGSSAIAAPRIDCGEVTRGEFAVIHPFSGSARKNWPMDRFRELARRLPAPVQWCAGPDDWLQDAVRIENLYELAQWLSAARIYIGNDSGITHLAAAAGGRVVAIFPATDPALWGPRGERVRIVSGGLDEIGADQVFDAVCRLLEASE